MEHDYLCKDCGISTEYDAEGDCIYCHYPHCLKCCCIISTDKTQPDGFCEPCKAKEVELEKIHKFLEEGICYNCCEKYDKCKCTTSCCLVCGTLWLTREAEHFCQMHQRCSLLRLQK